MLFETSTRNPCSIIENIDSRPHASFPSRYRRCASGKRTFPYVLHSSSQHRRLCDTCIQDSCFHHDGPSLDFSLSLSLSSIEQQNGKVIGLRRSMVTVSRCVKINFSAFEFLIPFKIPHPLCRLLSYEIFLTRGY